MEVHSMNTIVVDSIEDMNQKVHCIIHLLPGR